jgi:hypothetical protein
MASTLHSTRKLSVAQVILLRDLLDNRRPVKERSGPLWSVGSIADLFGVSNSPVWDAYHRVGAYRDIPAVPPCAPRRSYVPLDVAKSYAEAHS